jgi:hypothetical protein
MDVSEAGHEDALQISITEAREEIEQRKAKGDRQIQRAAMEH